MDVGISGFGEVSGERQAPGFEPLTEQLVEAGLVEGRRCLVEPGNFGGVDVDPHYRVAHGGEGGSVDGAKIAAADNRYEHVQFLTIECSWTTSW